MMALLKEQMEVVMMMEVGNNTWPCTWSMWCEQCGIYIYISKWLVFLFGFVMACKVLYALLVSL